jgi:hypothetical protein
MEKNMTNYHVEFDLAIDDSFLLGDSPWISKTDKLQQVKTDYGNVVIPAYATVVKTFPTYVDGYYVLKGFTSLLKRENSLWFYRDVQLGRWENWLPGNNSDFELHPSVINKLEFLAYFPEKE